MLVGSEFAGGGIGRVGDEIVAVLLDRHTEGADERLPGQFAVLANGHRYSDQAAVPDLAAFVHRRSVGRQYHVAIQYQLANANLVDLLWSVGCKANDVTILLNDRLRYPVCQS